MFELIVPLNNLFYQFQYLHCLDGANITLTARWSPKVYNMAVDVGEDLNAYVNSTSEPIYKYEGGLKMSLFRKKTNYGKIIAISVAALAVASAVAFVVYKLIKKYKEEAIYDDLLEDCDCDCDCIEEAEMIEDAE